MSEHTMNRSPKAFRRFAVPLILSFVILILAGFWLYYFVIVSQHTPKADRVIAVLPFLNESGDPQDDYFVRSVTEHLTTQLSKISGIEAISQRSLSANFVSTQNAAQIGKELNANFVLLGSVNRSDDEGEFEARLLDVNDGKQLWTGKYDFDKNTLFEVESKLSIEIAEVLSIKLTDKEREFIMQKPTASNAAYDFYLKGREYYYLYTNEGNEEAILMFKRALSLDQSFALAYAGLGDAYCKRTLEFGYSAKNLDSAIFVCNQALSLDPTVAETHKALGLIYYTKGWLRKCLEQWSRAIEIDPNYTDVINNFGVVLSQKGDLVEALEWIKKGIRLDPTQARGYLTCGELYADLIFDSAAMNWYNKAKKLDPNNLNYHVDVALLNMYHEHYSDAFLESTNALAIDSTNPLALEVFGFVNLKQKNYQKAEQCFQLNIVTDTMSEGVAALYYLHKKNGKIKDALELYLAAERYWKLQLQQGDEGFSIPYNLAVLYALNKNTEDAFLWLQRASDAGWLNYRWATTDPLLDGIRNEPRFIQMMNTIKETVDMQREALAANSDIELP